MASMRIAGALVLFVGLGARAQVPPSYWAYQPVTRPASPEVKKKDWPRGPIDNFVLSKLESHGLSPAPPASPATLIRRATYDLTGLPPSPDEVEAFVRDPDPQAYEKLLDRLLASPQYGEKWGRHWLDLVRYAETSGYERDGDKPFAWRYRDYVIRSFNEDKPYDRFLREQLAGDEMEPRTAETVTATGFYRLGVWDDEPPDKDLARFDGLDDVVSTIGQAMLAMTLGCARCHDHKKDPIPQEDYYRFLALVRGITPNGKDGPNVLTPVAGDIAGLAPHQEKLKKLQESASLLEREFSARQAAGKDLEDLLFRYYRYSWRMLPKFDEHTPDAEGHLAHNFFDLSPAAHEGEFGFVFEGKLLAPRTGRYTFTLDCDDGARLTIDGRTVVEYDGLNVVGSPRTGEVELIEGRHSIMLEYFQHSGPAELIVKWSGPGVAERPLSHRGSEALGREKSERLAALKREIQALRRHPPKTEMALSVTESARVEETFILRRGNPALIGAKVEPGFPRVLGAPGLPPPTPRGKSSGRRTRLADWITSPANPLTARVMANRLWQHHFGRGIVPTPNDFGKLGEPPTHPELLDWLASELVARQWSLKSMHRLIMTSAAYRMSGAVDPAALARDGANLLLWRFPLRRLTAEELRDSILAVNGTLNLKRGGPSIFPPMPREVLETASRPKDAWGVSPPEEAARRSVYVKVKRSLLPPLLAGHDFADTDSSCAARFSTTVPTQALTLLNSAFMAEQASLFAKRLADGSPGDLEKQVREALRAVTQRAPADAEVRRALALFEELRARDGLDEKSALSLVCLMALNLNEFVYVD